MDPLVADSESEYEDDDQDKEDDSEDSISVTGAFVCSRTCVS